MGGVEDIAIPNWVEKGARPSNRGGGGGEHVVKKFMSIRVKEEVTVHAKNDLVSSHVHVNFDTIVIMW